MSEKKAIKNKDWLSTFKNAFKGCLFAFRTERNFKVHFFLSFLVIVLALWLKISFERFLFLILAVILGLTLEMANTSFEAIINLVTEKWHPQAKIAKDIAAGMVLLASIGLAAIGFLILFPPLWQKILGGR